MDIPEFELPDWLEGCDADTIQQRMMSKLPSDIDNSEGGFPWDFTMPTALEISELLEYELPQTLMLMHPMWAYGSWLDYHAEIAGTQRKDANKASGILHITGVSGTEILSGLRFAVPTDGDTPSVEFEADQTYYIDSEGEVDITVVAVEAGTTGNVPASTITVMTSPIKGITSITNPEKTSGGTEQEDDDSLRDRIMEINTTSDASFVGCESDYKRWAKEVDGVGDVFIIPQWDESVPNSVKVVVMDSNGEPANQKILDDVYSYIYADNGNERKCPVGAILTVSAPEPVTLDISARVRLENRYDSEAVMEQYKKLLRSYYSDAKDEGVVKIAMIGSILINTQGVYDFDDLTLNGDTENISIDTDEYPVTGNIEWR
jgi:uncharacterized phage protein gp47/JayE